MLLVDLVITIVLVLKLSYSVQNGPFINLGVLVHKEHASSVHFGNSKAC